MCQSSTPFRIGVIYNFKMGSRGLVYATSHNLPWLCPLPRPPPPPVEKFWLRQWLFGIISHSHVSWKLWIFNLSLYSLIFFRGGSRIFMGGGGVEKDCVRPHTSRPRSPKALKVLGVFDTLSCYDAIWALFVNILIQLNGIKINTMSIIF